MKIGVILAGGKSTRFKSDIPKGLHKIGGKSIVSRILECFCNAGVSKTYIVVSEDSYDYYSKENFDVHYLFQSKLNGTGSAFYCVNGLYNEDDEIIVVNSDCFLFDKYELVGFFERFLSSGCGVGVIAKELDDCYGYGRIVLNNDLIKVVEQNELDITNNHIKLVNLGVYSFRGIYLNKYIKNLNNNLLENKITTLLEYESCYVHKTDNLILSLNNKGEYEQICKLYYLEVCKRLMSQGVKIYDSSSTYIDEDVIVGDNVEIYPNNYIFGASVIGDKTIVFPNCCIDNSYIGENCSIGPFSNIKSGSKLGSEVTVGAFVEIKNSELNDKVKAKHHAYLGDSFIGERTNVGCGAIVANYDGKRKNVTHIGKNCFIGSNVVLVAPVSVGDNVVIGAGSTIVDDINSNSLAIARSRQINKDNYYIE